MNCCTTCFKRGIGVFPTTLLMVFLLTLAGCGGGGDNGGDGASNPPPAGPTGQLAYEANWNSGNVSSFAVNSDNSLTVVGPPIAAGQHPHSLSVDTDARFVYVSNHESNFLSGYTVNRTTGVLTPIVSNSLTIGPSVHASVFSRDGRFLYVINGVPGSTPTSTISAFSINADGSLSPIGSSFPTGQHSHNLTLHPSGQFIYVASDASNQTFAFAVNATTGALSPIAGSPYPGFTGPLAVAIDRSGRFAYVGNTGGEIEAFSINTTTGALTELTPHIYATGGQYAHSIVFDSSDNFLYTGNINSNNVSGFQVNHTTGALTPVPGSPVSVGAQPEYVTAHPRAGYVYVSQFGLSNIARYAINATTGQLTLAGIFADPAATNGGVSGTMQLGFTD